MRLGDLQEIYKNRYQSLLGGDRALKKSTQGSISPGLLVTKAKCNGYVTKD